MSKNVHSVAIDPRDGKIYYGREASQYTVNRSNPDGTGSQVLYDLHNLDIYQPPPSVTLNRTATPWDVSIDTVNNKLYWSAGENNSKSSSVEVQTFIQRSNLDGTNVESLIQGGSNSFSPAGLVVNGATNKMYWADYATGDVKVANLDGTNQQTLYNSTGRLWALAADFEQGKLFWSSVHTSQQGIWTSNLDGTNAHQLLSHSTSIPGHSSSVTRGLDVDPTTSRIYYNEYHGANLGIGNISSMNYDGSGIQIVMPSIKGPVALAVAVPEPSSYVVTAISGLIFLIIARRKQSKRVSGGIMSSTLI